MTGPCLDCTRNSLALAVSGAHLEAMRAAWRPKSVLGLEADALLRAVGGKAEAGLHTKLDLAVERARSEEQALPSICAACRHQGDFEFPDALASDPEPPWALWVHGSPGALTRACESPSAGVVGARRADAYGNAVARDIGRAVARAGGTVVSGLAFGIDASAHRGALDVEAGATVAVTGGGVDVVYPKAHRQLHREIVDRGAVVSEMPPGTALWKWSFPARNRLIAAISDLVVVVQGARHSGSLHTADAALARNIPVAAVPGRIDAGVSQGSNLLLADGALVVTEPSVVVRALGLDPDDKKAAIKADLVEACEAISADRVDDYLLQVGTQVGNSRLARLELLGLVETGTDGRWRLVG